MDANTIISLCVKTGVWGIVIDPKLGAKQCFLSGKLIITLLLWIILNVLFAWVLGETLVDMVAAATPESIAKLYFMFMLIFGAAGCIFFIGISAPAINTHFNHPSGRIETRCIVIIILQTLGFLISMDLLKLNKALSSGSSVVAIIAILLPMLAIEIYVYFMTFLYDRVCSAIVSENLKSTIVKGTYLPEELMASKKLFDDMSSATAGIHLCYFAGI